MPFRSEPPTPPDHAFPDRPAAWDYLRHLISIIQSLFGTPGELTLLGGISDSFRADMASWLRPCERLARLLLFAEAAELKLKPRAIPVPRRGRRAPFGRETCRSPKSETWRVAFKLLPPPSRRGAGARGYFTPSINQRPLAARLEALIRVVLDPARHAKRLARRLEHRARFLAKAIARVFDTPRTDKNPLLRIVEGALHLAWPAKLRFDSG